LGVTVGRAYQLVDEAMRETVQEPAEDLRKLELERLDLMTAALMDKARRGRLRAINTMLNIMERRAKLLGLDAPDATFHGIGKTLGVAHQPVDQAFGETPQIQGLT
jgi:hypothetical protein